MMDRPGTSTALPPKYTPTALYYEDADTVEYVVADTPCVYRRVDGILTLALDMDSRETIGFQLKGFKNLFLNHIKPTHDLLDSDFIVMVSVIENVVSMQARELFPAELKAYQEARTLAWQNQVAMRRSELPQAA